MAWLDDVLHGLTAADAWGYHGNQPTNTEPAALAAMALVDRGNIAAAQRPLAWLVEHQWSDGSVGATGQEDSPGWTTSLAILAWRKADLLVGATNHRSELDRALAWTLRTSGQTLDHQADMGHDTTLTGWPWVEGTHSWLEPTAYAVLALKAAGYRDHPRTREAVQLIIDRLLPDGGCNYGNTLVLGQSTRPHVQPSGIALAAVHEELDPSGRVRRTADFLQSSLAETTTAASLSFACLGLGAANALPQSAGTCLAGVARKALRRGASPYQLALLVLAASAAAKPLQ